MGLHTAVSVIFAPSLLQYREPSSLYPLPHVGWQCVLLASEDVQLPTAPFGIVLVASHGKPQHSSRRTTNPHDTLDFCNVARRLRIVVSWRWQ